MASITGTVAQIKVAPRTVLAGNPTAATVVLIDQATNTKETFILWLHQVNEFVSPTLAIAEVSSLSLLRDALVNKLNVTIVTPSPTSNQIQSVAVPP